MPLLRRGLVAMLAVGASSTWSNEDTPIDLAGVCKVRSFPEYEAKALNATEGSSECVCHVNSDSDCECTGPCSPGEERRVCVELIGDCRCQREGEDRPICECFGYCPTRKLMRRACWTEVGCEWAGPWCQAQLGLVWEEPPQYFYDELELESDFRMIEDLSSITNFNQTRVMQAIWDNLTLREELMQLLNVNTTKEAAMTYTAKVDNYTAEVEQIRLRSNQGSNTAAKQDNIESVNQEM